MITEVSQELETSLLNKVLAEVKEVGKSWTCPAERVLVLCVSPDYSGIVALRVLHALSKDGELPQHAALDVAYPKDPQEKKDSYKRVLQVMAPHFKKIVDKVVLVEAAVLTGNNYQWIQEELVKVGFAQEDILTLALLEHKDSVTKCKIVGDYTNEVPTFYWEEYNKHWD
jgi:hypothetical protein